MDPESAQLAVVGSLVEYLRIHIHEISIFLFIGFNNSVEM